MRFKKTLCLLLSLVLMAMLVPWGTGFAGAEDEQLYIITGWKDASGNTGAVQSVTVNDSALAEDGAAISLEPGASCNVTVLLTEGFVLSEISDGVMLSFSSAGENLTTSDSASSITAPSEEWLLANPDNPSLVLNFATQQESNSSSEPQALEALTLKITAPKCGTQVEFDETTKEYSYLPEIAVTPTELQSYASFVWVEENEEAYMNASAVTEQFTIKGGDSYRACVLITTDPTSLDKAGSPGAYYPIPAANLQAADPCPYFFDKDQLTISVEEGSLVQFDVVSDETSSTLICVIEFEAVHIPGDPVEENFVQPLCEEDGSHDVVVHCTKCSEIISSESVTDERLGHDWNEWVVSKEPTVDAPGERARTCKRNPKHKETEPIPPLESWTVTFETNGGSAVAAVRVEKGKPVAKPKEPTKKDATFACWCSDPELKTAYNFSSPVNSDITLYAKWTEKSKIKYSVVAGGGTIWGKGGVREVEIVVKRSVDDKECFNHFTGVQIDGIDLTRDSDYTASAGSTVIKLKPVAMNRYNTGNHTVTILFDDGKAVAGLIIKAGTGGGTPGATPGNGGGAGNPNTGDTDTAIWIGLLAASALCISGIAVVIVKKSKKK